MIKGFVVASKIYSDHKWERRRRIDGSPGKSLHGLNDALKLKHRINSQFITKV